MVIGIITDQAQVILKCLAWPRKRRSPDDGIWRIAENFPVLSCDIFDTALRRTIARPEDIFLAVGLRARSRVLIHCPPDAFAAYRITTESRVRARVEADGHDEVQIAEIYQELRSLDIVTDAGATARLEFEVECATCRPIEPVRRALAARAASENNSRTVFTSDSCLPGAWLAELLQLNAYGDKCEVFSSADLRLSKHTGRLFPALIAAIGCSPERATAHRRQCGFRRRASAKAHGIVAMHRKRPRPRPEEGNARHPVVRLADSQLRARAAETVLDADKRREKSPAADGRALAAMCRTARDRV